MSKSTTFVMHEKTSNAKNQRRTFKGIVKDNTLSIGVSVCGPKDQFVKALGRAISFGRAIKKPSLTLTLSADDDTRETFFNALKTL